MLLAANATHFILLPAPVRFEEDVSAPILEGSPSNTLSWFYASLSDSALSEQCSMFSVCRDADAYGPGSPGRSRLSQWTGLATKQLRNVRLANAPRA